jgi:hypothetical protein
VVSTRAWHLGGRTALTDGPGIGLSATDRWAAVFDFSTRK